MTMTMTNRCGTDLKVCLLSIIALPLPISSAGITLPSIATLCHSFGAVLSWIHSAQALHHHAKDILSPDCNWKILHIAPLRPQPVPPNSKPIGPLTCRDLLTTSILHGITPQDEVWLKALPEYDQSASNFDSKGQVHCEATLMALTANPSTSYTKNAGIEKVSLFDIV